MADYKSVAEQKMKFVLRKRTIFGRDDHLLTVPAGFHPFTNPLFRLLALVIVGGIDEVAEFMVNIC